MNTLLLLLCMHSVPGAENYRYHDSCFLDSADLVIVLNSKTTILYQLTGEPVEDSLKKKQTHYIRNYAVKDRKNLTRNQTINLLIPLLDGNHTATEKSKCPFIAGQCIKFISGKNELLLFLSGAGTCGEGMRVLKINSLSKKQAMQTFTKKSFTVITG